MPARTCHARFIVVQELARWPGRCGRPGGDQPRRAGGPRCAASRSCHHRWQAIASRPQSWTGHRLRSCRPRRVPGQQTTSGKAAGGRTGRTRVPLPAAAILFQVEAWDVNCPQHTPRNSMLATWPRRFRLCRNGLRHPRQRTSACVPKWPGIGCRQVRRTPPGAGPTPARPLSWLRCECLLDADHLPDVILRPIAHAISPAISSKRMAVAGSPNQTMPIATVPTAPIPVQIA